MATALSSRVSASTMNGQDLLISLATFIIALSYKGVWKNNCCTVRNEITKNITPTTTPTHLLPIPIPVCVFNLGGMTVIGFSGLGISYPQLKQYL
jgi:hypothetical protein